MIIKDILRVMSKILLLLKESEKIHVSLVGALQMIVVYSFSAVEEQSHLHIEKLKSDQNPRCRRMP